jgi:hypothetical protein
MSIKSLAFDPPNHKKRCAEIVANPRRVDRRLGRAGFEFGQPSEPAINVRLGVG